MPKVAKQNSEGLKRDKVFIAIPFYVERRPPYGLYYSPLWQKLKAKKGLKRDAPPYFLFDFAFRERQTNNTNVEKRNTVSVFLLRSCHFCLDRELAALRIRWRSIGSLRGDASAQPLRSSSWGCCSSAACAHVDRRETPCLARSEQLRVEHAGSRRVSVRRRERHCCSGALRGLA